MDQSISARGQSCCTLSPAPAAPDAGLGQLSPPTFADPSPSPSPPATSQVLLQGLSAPLANPPGALVAVARVVTNVQEYK